MDEVELSTEEMLKEVKKAIYAVMVGGQSYKIGSRELTRANLTELKNMKVMLEAEISQVSGEIFDNTFVAKFGGR